MKILGQQQTALRKKLKDFVEQLSSKQFKEIEKFFETMPKLSHTINVKNPKTGVNNEVTLEGLTSFSVDNVSYGS